MKKPVYSLELILEVVQKYLEGSRGYLRLANEYNIASTGDLHSWVTRYKKHGVDGLKNVHN